MSVMIGADPEFAATGSDGVVPAHDFISSSGATRRRFGTDGCSSIFEIRPRPSMDPLKVVKNIRTAMMRGASSHPEATAYDWKAGSLCGRYALGGHIHFGLEVGLSLQQYAGPLDTYLSQIMILVEDATEARERRRVGYGGVSQCRSQPWGFEYRTPSSWIVSPQMSSSVLCLAKTIVHECLTHGLAVTKKGLAPNNDRFCAADKPHFLRKFPTLWSHIQKMSLYSQYKEHIDLIDYLVKKELDWFPRKDGKILDMKAAWGIKKKKFVLSKAAKLEAMVHIGDQVILGRHLLVNGGTNWASSMDRYVGSTARVTAEYGRDAEGCRCVYVNLTGRNYVWRTRDMRRVS